MGLKDLTKREKEILDLLIESSSNSYIAFKLGISEKTVETHLTQVYKKIGVNCRSAAIIAVLRNIGTLREIPD